MKHHRIIVNERRPPRSELRVGIEGWLEWQLLRRKYGHFGPPVAYKGAEQHNLILDVGLDSLFSGGLIGGRTGGTNFTGETSDSPFWESVVGTGSTEPATSQTGLESQLANTVNTGSQPQPFERISNGVYQKTRVREYDFSEAIGVLTEWGFRKLSASGLFTRELFRDGLGDPTTITKTIDDKLRKIYRVRVSLSPTSSTAHSFDITGLSPSTRQGTMCLIGTLNTDGFADFLAINRMLIGNTNLVRAQAVNSQAALVYDQNLSAGAVMSSLVQFAYPAYSLGSFERLVELTFATGDYNISHKAWRIGTSTADSAGSGVTGQVGWIFRFNDGDEFTKDSLHRVRISDPNYFTKVTVGRL